MDMLSKYFSSEVEHITSSLCSYTLLLAAKLHLPLKNNNPKQHRNGYCYGLQTLVHSEEKQLHPTPRILHCYATSKAFPSSPPSPPPRRLSKSLWSPSSPALRSTVMGDVIGTESGDCMSCDVAEEEVEAKAEPESESESSRGRERSGTRQFPPPITLLRQTGQMPWTFKREYSDDGRLVIRAERSVEKRREYVEARRENGRLIMRLVPEDDNAVCCEECGWPMEEEEELEDLEFNGLECVDDEEEEEEEFEEELAKEGGNSSQKSSLENGSERCGGLRQCASYAGGLLVRDSDSFCAGDANAYLGRPGSAPLQPMTPVM